MKKIERIKDKAIIALVYLITIILAVLLLTSCKDYAPVKGQVNEFSIIEVDSCEYLYVTGAYKSGLAHKGNCRYCAERNRRMIREQVDSILTEIYD